MNNLLSVGAIGFATLALGASLWQGWVGNEHNRLSVRPLIVATPYLEGPRARNGLYLANLGLGPAIIDRASIVFDRTAYDLTADFWEEALVAMDIETICFTRSWIPAGAAIREDQEIALLAITDPSMQLCLHESLKLLTEHRIELNLNYRSLYGERLTSTDTFTLRSPREDYARALRKLNAAH